MKMNFKVTQMHKNKKRTGSKNAHNFKRKLMSKMKRSKTSEHNLLKLVDNFSRWKKISKGKSHTSFQRSRTLFKTKSFYQMKFRRLRKMGNFYHQCFEQKHSSETNANKKKKKQKLSEIWLRRSSNELSLRKRIWKMNLKEKSD